VGFRRAEHHPAVDLGRGLLDLETAAQRVDVAYAQRGQLTEAQPAVCEHANDQLVFSGGIGEGGDLLVAVETLVSRSGMRQLDARRGVAREPVVTDS
jgi:hypothetical protein